MTFLSYAREDAEFALTLARELRRAGADVWLDQLDIRAGRRWDREVELALANCKEMVVVLSPSSCDSDNVMDEVAFALENGKHVIPIVKSNCNVPFRLRRLHYVDFTSDREQAVKALLLALAIEAKESSQATAAGPPSAIQTNLDRSVQELLDVFDGDKARHMDFAVRLESAEALGRAGDPRLRETNWVRIAGHKKVKTFEIGRYPVTVTEYQRFMNDGGYADQRWWKTGGYGKSKEPDKWEEQKQHPNWPVVNVSWYEAAAYAAWCGARLPTEEEWELAARGREGREYPWGNEEPDETRANYGETGPQQVTPVGLYLWGATPEGVQDMAGNVWEWVDSWGDEKKKYRVLRGGSWYDMVPGLPASPRARTEPENRLYGNGFRVARDVSST